MKASFSSLRGYMRVDTKSAAICTNALERNYLLRKCEASKLRKTKLQGRKDQLVSPQRKSEYKLDRNLDINLDSNDILCVLYQTINTECFLIWTVTKDMTPESTQIGDQSSPTSTLQNHLGSVTTNRAQKWLCHTPRITTRGENLKLPLTAIILDCVA